MAFLRLINGGSSPFTGRGVDPRSVPSFARTPSNHARPLKIGDFPNFPTVEYVSFPGGAHHGSWTCGPERWVAYISGAVFMTKLRRNCGPKIFHITKKGELPSFEVKRWYLNSSSKQWDMNLSNPNARENIFFCFDRSNLNMRWFRQVRNTLLWGTIRCHS